jgi:hypothetical protein
VLRYYVIDEGAFDGADLAGRDGLPDGIGRVAECGGGAAGALDAGEQWKQERRLEGEQRGEKRGEQRGFQLGEQKGRPQGEAVLLLRLLERRFGMLLGWAMNRVLAADSAALETWSMRVLDAASVEEILAGR